MELALNIDNNGRNDLSLVLEGIINNLDAFRQKIDDYRLLNKCHKDELVRSTTTINSLTSQMESLCNEIENKFNSLDFKGPEIAEFYVNLKSVVDGTRKVINHCYEAIKQDNIFQRYKCYKQIKGYKTAIKRAVLVVNDLDEVGQDLNSKIHPNSTLTSLFERV